MDHLGHILNIEQHPWYWVPSGGLCPDTRVSSRILQQGSSTVFFPSMLLYVLSNSPPSGMGSLGGLLKNTGLLK